EKVLLYIEATSRNPQCGVHRRELPRERLVEEVDRAELVVVDRELTDLYYDLEFAYNLMKSLGDDDSLSASILRGLNEVCNLLSLQRRETIGKCRRIVRDSFAGGDSGSKHVVTAVGHAH